MACGGLGVENTRLQISRQGTDWNVIPLEVFRQWLGVPVPVFLVTSLPSELPVAGAEPSASLQQSASRFCELESVW